jgi:hypothetical protein
MSHSRRGNLVLVICLTAFASFPRFVLGSELNAARGLAVSSKSSHPLDAGIFFSGNFSYSLGGGQATLQADNVTNPNSTATGPLRFSLWFTPARFPSAGNNTAHYDITASLAAGQPINSVSGAVPFTNPPTGCYYVSLVLEENVNDTWTTRDFGTFSKSFDIGGGCITSFTANPANVSSGGPSTLSWTTTGESVTSVSIDNGVGAKPANGSATVNPVATTTYTLSAFTTANGSAPTKKVTVTIGPPAPTVSFSATPGTIASGQNSTLIWSTTNAVSVTIDHGVGSQPASGSTIVHPTQTTTYILTATGAGGTATSQATVTIASPAPAKHRAVKH